MRDRSQEGRIAAALASGDGPRDMLATFARGLLGRLLCEISVALDRTAMASPDLAARLLSSGRHRIRPLVRDYLGSLHARG